MAAGGTPDPRDLSAPIPSRWVPTPVAAVRLAIGLLLFGAGEGLIIFSALGNTPWTVLAEGVSDQTPLSVGAATVVISFLVLALWLAIRQQPGIGTIANAVLIGVSIDLTLRLLPDDAAPGIRIAVLAAGIALVAVGSGLYLGARLGPGPRDGLMTGIHRRTGWPIAPVRIGIEVSAVAAGAILGGTVGIGTLIFAFTIGPAVALALRLLYHGPLHHL
jgi:uncharacterized membrane protein YczE